MRVLLGMMLILMVFFGSASVFGYDHHAVLIGPCDYPYITPPLSGPENDVVELKKLLVSKYGFLESKIHVLVKEAATKQNILKAVSDLRETTKPGDFIFIYFSGHGTSPYDTDLNLPMDDQTGAWLPYDFQIDPKNPKKTVESAIVARTELRPIFSELDADRNLLVIVDACFSGNAVRSTASKSKGEPRHVPLVFTDYTPEIRTEKSEPTPYRNLIFISAADKGEKAEELRDGMALYDGKAHGTLTDALLRGLDGMADTDQDGKLTYQELYQFSKQDTQKYGHTPQILYRSSLDQPVFHKDVKIAASKPGVCEGIACLNTALRVKVEGADADSLAAKLQPIAGVEVTNGSYDLLISCRQNTCAVSLSGGEILTEADQKDEAVKIVQSYAKVRELIGLKNPRQHFNVWLQAGDYDGKTVFYLKEEVSFTIKSDEDAYLILLDIDSHGDVCILLPESGTAEPYIKKHIPLIKKAGRVEPPLGVEFLKLFAFKTKPEGIQSFAEGDGMVKALSDRFPKFLDFIKNQTGWSETLIQVVTRPSKN